MITAEQIPHEVVEAAARAAHDVWRIQASVGDDINEYAPLHEMPANLQQEYREQARAAIAAALNAWPKMTVDGETYKGVTDWHIHLPLKEYSDD